MFVDPDHEFRVTSGDPPDDADRRSTGPAPRPSEEPDVTFLDGDPDGADDDSSDSEPEDDEVSRPSR